MNIQLINDLSSLFNNEELLEFYSKRNEKVSNLKTRIDFLENKINVLENYRNYTSNDFESLLKPLKFEIETISNKKEHIESNINSLSHKLTENGNTLNVYQSYLEQYQNKKEKIEKAIKYDSDLEKTFQLEYQNICRKITMLSDMITSIKKNNEEIRTKLSEDDARKKYYSKLEKTLEEKISNYSKAKSNSTSNVDIEILINDKKTLLSLKQNLSNIDNSLNVSEQFNNILKKYKDGEIDEDTFIINLLDLKTKIITDKELRQNKPHLVDDIVKKIDNIKNTIENTKSNNFMDNFDFSKDGEFGFENNSPVLKDSDLKNDMNEQAKLDGQEIVAKRKAKEETIKKLSKKLKKIAIFCLPALFIANFAINKSFSKKIQQQSPSDTKSIEYVTDTEKPSIDLPYVDLLPDDFNKENVNNNIIPSKDGTKENSNLLNHIKVKENSYIYDNSYDAIDNKNPLRPYFDNDIEKETYGVTLQLPDGTIKTLYKSDSTFNGDYNNLIKKGAVLKLYLTGSNNEYEGFYKESDVISVGKKR